MLKEKPQGKIGERHAEFKSTKVDFKKLLEKYSLNLKKKQKRIELNINNS